MSPQKKELYKLTLLVGILLACCQAVMAAPVNYAVPITVTVTNAPSLISLNWPSYSTATQYQISRRPTNTTSWTLFATLTNSPATITGWTDSNVVVGTLYEYKVARYAAPTGYGFVVSSICRPAEDSRGKVILMVASNQTVALSNELFRLHKDLVADGWTVLRHDIAPVHWNNTNAWMIAVTNNKAIIKTDYDSDPMNVKAVFLFGHIAVPYSGVLNPDAHSDHLGAWPADAYYGDMDGIWTDTWNTYTQNTTRIKNAIGDGKFDQTSIPSDIDLQVGRVDLYDMPCFTGLSETNLLKQYLDKDHQYRYSGFVFNNRGTIDDNFSDFGNEAFAQDGWRNFGHMFGSSNVVGADFFATLATNACQWGYGCGAGGSTSCNGVGSSTTFTTNDPRAVFTMMFGSWFGDWDVQNNFLRAGLGTRSFTLSCSWGGRPDNYYHAMTIGETLGECIRQSQNNNSYDAVSDYYRRYVHVALMGDPTLRLHMIRPPTLFNGTKSGGLADLAWIPSPDTDVLGYNVYRSTTYTDSFTRINASLIAGTNYTDSSAPAGTLIYLLRPVSLKVSTSGSYTNIGQGVYAEIGDIPNGIPVASNQAFTIAEDTFSPVTLTGSDPETNALTYSISTIPSHGYITGALPNIVYCSYTNFFGTDFFTFTVNDGKVDSPTGTISYTVTPVNDAPVAYAQTVTNVQGVSTSIVLTAYDVEGSPLTYEIYSPPSHGAITGTPPNILYTADLLYSGNDSFTFRANDGTTNGATATVTLPVLAYIEPSTPEGTLSNGVIYQTYTGRWANLPAFDSLTPITSGTTTNFVLSVAPTSTWYAIRYKSYLNSTTNGLYVFFTTSADGSKLYIGTNEVVNNNGIHAAQERSGQIALKSGFYPITVAYFRSNAVATLTNSWSGPAFSKQIIPSSRLFYVSYTTNGTSVNWLISKFGVTNDYTTIESGDQDGDGMSTYAEYLAGTEPTEGNSVFEILELQTYESSNAVLWYGTTNSGCTNLFSIAIRTNLVDDLWSVKGSNLSRNASGTNLWWHINPPSNTPVYYRVIIQ